MNFEFGWKRPISERFRNFLDSNFFKIRNNFGTEFMPNCMFIFILELKFFLNVWKGLQSKIMQFGQLKKLLKFVTFHEFLFIFSLVLCNVLFNFRNCYSSIYRWYYEFVLTVNLNNARPNPKLLSNIILVDHIFIFHSLFDYSHHSKTNVVHRICLGVTSYH